MPIGSELIYRHEIEDAAIVGSIFPVATPALDATPFSKWKTQNASQAINSALSPIHYRAQQMYEGNHWQGGWGWIGPHPDPVDDPQQEVTEAWAEIGAGFVSRNVVREIARRFRRAAMGREPRWALVPRDMNALEETTDSEPSPIIPPPKETADPNARARDRQRFAKESKPKRKKIPDKLKKLIDEASRSLTLWWDDRGIHELFQKIITTLQMPSGRAIMRIYVPDGLRQVRVESADGTRTRRLGTSTTLDDALAKLYPEHPTPFDSVVYEDAKTKRKCGVVKYTIADESSASGRELVELTYLDEKGEQTLVRTIDGDKESAAVPLELGGRLLVYEATMEPIITEQMIQLQRALNLALTMLPRNITTSGFLNRIITNGKLPGYWEVDANNKRTGKYIVTEIPTFGAGYTNYIKGEEVANKDGTKTLTPVGIHETPPVDPTPTLRGARGLYEAMLEEGEQDHILNRSADNANSGRSQEQGRAGFESASDELATRINRMGRWFIETSLAAAEHMMGTPGKYTSQLRAVFECRTKIGPVSTDERASYITAYEKGVIALETAQEAIGVYDVDAERDKIDTQEGGAIDLRIRQANAFKMFIDSKLHGELAGELVGFDPELLARIGASFDESVEREAEQAQAQLETQVNVAETRAKAGVGQGVGGGRPSGAKKPGKRQGQSKLTQKQSEKDRKRPTA